MTSQLPNLLTVCGLDEIAGHAPRAVSHVLSILDPGWPEPDFSGYPRLERTVLRFHDCIEPAPGILLPSAADIEAILAFGRGIAADREGVEAHLLVHCHAGISRSTAAMSIILAQARPDQDEALVMAEVARIRPQAWPNLRMIEFADAALDRSGRLIAAVASHYRRRLQERPDLAATMVALDRAREVEIARA